MILLDTNIVSAVMSATPPDRVIRWLNGQETTALYVSTITIAEIGYGDTISRPGSISNLP